MNGFEILIQFYFDKLKWILIISSQWDFFCLESGLLKSIDLLLKLKRSISKHETKAKKHHIFRMNIPAEEIDFSKLQK